MKHAYPFIPGHKKGFSAGWNLHVQGTIEQCALYDDVNSDAARVNNGMDDGNCSDPQLQRGGSRLVAHLFAADFQHIFGCRGTAHEEGKQELAAVLFQTLEFLPQAVSDNCNVARIARVFFSPGSPRWSDIVSEAMSIPFDEVCRSGWPLYALMVRYLWNEENVSFLDSGADEEPVPPEQLSRASRLGQGVPVDPSDFDDIDATGLLRIAARPNLPLSARIVLGELARTRLQQSDFPEVLKLMTRLCIPHFRVNFGDLTWCLG
eukprot:GEMP01011659.1.p2 GENE.GEMP01011659.1~~GEMP01011659.1.p2  ORF type:complete len:263 (+),score=65.39 GEMP01011659.1:1362-2150(+)